MAEQIDYGAPLQANSGSTFLKAQELELSLEKGTIRVVFIGANGVRIVCFWRDSDGEGATTKIVALNKANLSTKSLLRRLIEQAVADGKIPTGTISGLPD